MSASKQKHKSSGPVNSSMVSEIGYERGGIPSASKETLICCSRQASAWSPSSTGVSLSKMEGRRGENPPWTQKIVCGGEWRHVLCFWRARKKKCPVGSLVGWHSGLLKQSVVALCTTTLCCSRSHYFFYCYFFLDMLTLQKAELFRQSWRKRPKSCRRP